VFNWYEITIAKLQLTSLLAMLTYQTNLHLCRVFYVGFYLSAVSCHQSYGVALILASAFILFAVLFKTKLIIFLSIRCS